MAIRCEFIDVIVPIKNIDRVFPGGFKAFKEENKKMFGGRLWRDDFLFRDGAMNPNDVRHVVEFWQRYGLQPKESRDGQDFWKDLCVVEHMFEGPTLPCEWIVFDNQQACVSLKGQPIELIIGRDNFKPAL
jgi:hypothetical protein